MNTTIQDSYLAVRIRTCPEALIELTGELDLAGVPIFDAAVRDLDLSGLRGVVLDLGRLTFIDAAGVHAVLRLHKECLNASTGLTILPGPRNVQRVFALTGVDELVSCRPVNGGKSQATHERRRTDGSR